MVRSSLKSVKVAAKTPRSPGLPRSRPPLARMLQLHERLRANMFPNCSKLAAELEVSTKTIQRDIDFMRDRLNLPIAYDQLQFGFFYSEPVTSFPSIEVSEGEVLALFVAQIALRQYQGTAFEQRLRSAFQKITDGLNDRIVFDWDEVDAAISFRGVGSSEADLETFEVVSSGVLRSQEIGFQYRKLESKRWESRRLQPYHVGYIERQWYVFGFDLMRQQLRTFALPRMRQARNTGLKFRRPADFSIADHLGDSFGVFRGKGKYRVRIRFDAFATRLVRERKWHASQQIKFQRDGGSELSMTLGSLWEIERWVLSWGTHALVLAPTELARQVQDQATALAGIYGKGGIPADNRRGRGCRTLEGDL